MPVEHPFRDGLPDTSNSQYVRGRLGFVEEIEMPEFKCSDIGMQCGFKTQAPSREEILLKIGLHAASVHDMKEVPPDVLKSIQNAIKY